MANILDKKQDVINFQLTKHGRKMLGQGILMPEYVSFFDDGLVYDTQHDGISEDQNNSSDRILYDTVTFGAITLDDKAALFPLGKSSVNSEYAPCWNFRLLNGKIDSHDQDNSSYYEKNFTLQDIDYGVRLNETAGLFFEGENLTNFEFENGKSVELIEDYILIDLSEENVDDDFKNFEAEIYIKKYVRDDITPQQLQFIETPNNIIDGIIYDEEELPSRFRKLHLTTLDSAYFLDILADDEIDEALLVPTKKPLAEVVDGTYKTAFEGPVKDDC